MTNAVATRQQSASTTRIKRPRLQVVVSEPIVAQIEELAKERGTSVSATCSWILEKYFEANPIQHQTTRDKQDDEAWLKVPELQNEKNPDFEEVAKMFKMMKLAKEAGIL